MSAIRTLDHSRHPLAAPDFPIGANWGRALAATPPTILSPAVQCCAILSAATAQLKARLDPPIEVVEWALRRVREVNRGESR